MPLSSAWQCSSIHVWTPSCTDGSPAGQLCARPDTIPCCAMLQDGWGWGASLLNPFSGSNDPMSLFGLGDSTPAGPAPEQDFFGIVSHPPEEEASTAQPSREEAASGHQPAGTPEQARHPHSSALVHA